MGKLSSVRVLGAISLVSFLGIFAAFLFQILTARYLGPIEFSLFAAFLAIVNIGAIGSSALQNAVTVQTARSIAAGTSESKSSRFDPTLIEATVIGMVFFIAIAAFSGPLANYLEAPSWTVFLAAISLILSFLLARNLGIIQGSGRALSTVWWSSGHAIVRLILSLSVFLFTFGFGGFVAVVMVSLFIMTAWVSLYLRKIPNRPDHAPFDRATVAVLLSTIAFAWLTNVDVIFLRALASPLDSGNYAVVALLVKTGFIIPGTLSLYFLPKLIEKNSKSSGLAIPIAITTLGILALTTFLWLFGPLVVRTFFGANYVVTSEFLLLMCVSLAPWVLLQTILIRTNGLATIAAPIVLILSAAIQWPIFAFTLPNIEAMIISNGALGIFVCLVLWAILLVKGKRSAVDRNSGLANPMI
jgi:O-antigen/teichoic acid export membrane protein